MENKIIKAEKNKIRLYDEASGAMVVDIDPDKGVGIRYSVVVDLSEQDGDVVNIHGKGFITRTGVDRLQRAAGLSIIMPSSVSWGGKTYPNPHMESISNVLNRVIIRMMVFGPSATGQAVCTDFFLAYDLKTVWLQMLAKLHKKYPKIIQISTKEQRPDGNWAFYPIDMEVGYWVNLSSPDMQQKYAEFIDKRQYAERIAQSIAYRRAVTSHPAIGGPYAERTQKGWQKRIVAVRYKQDPRGIAQKIEQIAAGKLPDVEKIQIEKKEDVIDVDVDESMAMAEEVEAELQEPEPEPEQKPEEIKAPF